MPIAHVLTWRRRASSWRPIKATRDALSLIGASSTLPRMPLAKRVLLKVNRARGVHAFWRAFRWWWRSTSKQRKRPAWRGLVPVEVSPRTRLGVRGALGSPGAHGTRIASPSCQGYGVAAALSNHQLPVTRADGNESIRKPSVTSAASKATVAKPVPNSR